MTSDRTKPSYAELVACIEALRPYAASRAEDMNEASGDTCPAWLAANKAVEHADALIKNAR
jgi:hypothetical protein